MTRPGKAIRYFNENAVTLSAQYNGMDRGKVHAELLRRLPRGKKLRLLDVGAGSGADAGFFAALGHEVVAAEPARNLRAIACKTFTDRKIKWVGAALPGLKSVSIAARGFDVVYSVGTLQYLGEKQRAKALARMASLLKEGGLLEIQYPTPPSREHQFPIESREIPAFVKLFNQTARRGRKLKIVYQEDIPDFGGRKALDGSDLRFHTAIIKCLKKRVNKPRKSALRG